MDAFVGADVDTHGDAAVDAHADTDTDTDTDTDVDKYSNKHISTHGCIDGSMHEGISVNYTTVSHGQAGVDANVEKTYRWKQWLAQTHIWKQKAPALFHEKGLKIDNDIHT